MTHSSPRTTRLGRGVVLMAAFLLAACTASGGGGDKDANSPPSSAPSSPRTATEPSQKTLTEQAQAALAAVHGGKLVEAGVERVTDGIHTEPSLTKGKSYRLNLVCVGHGSAKLRFEPPSIGTAADVPCDGSVVQQRIRVDKVVRVDVDGAEGATGMVAWQIDAI